MSYRSRRTKTNGDQAMHPDISSHDIESQPRTHPLLQREDRQSTKTKHLGLTKHSAPPTTISKPVAKKPRVLPSNLDSNSRPTRGVSITTLRDKVPSARPHVEERSQPTNVQQKFTFPPHLDPSFVRVSQKSRPYISVNANSEERSQPIEVPQTFTQPSRPQQSDTEPPQAGVEAQDIDDHMRDVAESETESLEQGNEQENVRKSKSSRARTMKSRIVAPNWTDPLNIDEKEDILTIDAEKNQKILSGSIQPRDIDNLEDGVRCIVHFNEFNQPIRKAGFVLVKYLGSLGKLEKFCPIGADTWHDVHALYKADIIKRVREKFVIPNGVIFDKAILMRVAKYWRHYKYTLKVSKFDPDKRTKEQIINDIPPGHTKDNWMRLVEYRYTLKSQNLSSVGKDARASQSHVHTTGCISYANKRADFVESTGKQPSHLEFFQMTHTKVAGGFVDNTISSQFLDEARSKVDEQVRNSSPSKSRVDIENDVFDKLMYEHDHPKRPVGFGFGVKQSQVFGVHGILRKRGYESTTTTNNSIELEIMRASMQKENQELRSKLDETNQLFLQALDAIRSGKFSDEAFNAIQLVLCKPNSEVASAASGNNTHNGLDDLPSSSSPN